MDLGREADRRRRRLGGGAFFFDGMPCPGLWWGFVGDGWMERHDSSWM